MVDIKEQILGAVDEAVADFMYYNRKNCESLPLGVIDDAISNNVITLDEIAERFKNQVKGDL